MNQHQKEHFKRRNNETGKKGQRKRKMSVGGATSPMNWKQKK